MWPCSKRGTNGAVQTSGEPGQTGGLQRGGRLAARLCPRWGCGVAIGGEERARVGVSEQVRSGLDQCLEGFQTRRWTTGNEHLAPTGHNQKTDGITVLIPDTSRKPLVRAGGYGITSRGPMCSIEHPYKSGSKSAAIEMGDTMCGNALKHQNKG